VGLGWSPFHEWTMVHGSRFWLDLAQLSAVGLGSLITMEGGSSISSCGGWFYSPPVLYGYPGYPVGRGRGFPRGVHPRAPSIVR